MGCDGWISIHVVCFFLRLVSCRYYGYATIFFLTALPSKEYLAFIPSLLLQVWTYAKTFFFFLQVNFIVKNLEQDVICITVFDRDLFSPNGKMINRKRVLCVKFPTIFTVIELPMLRVLNSFLSFIFVRLFGPHRSKLGEASIKRQRSVA